MLGKGFVPQCQGTFKRGMSLCVSIDSVVFESGSVDEDVKNVALSLI